jgi:hypothetical protein
VIVRGIVRVSSHLWATVHSTFSLLISISQAFADDLIWLFVPHEQAQSSNWRCAAVNSVKPESMKAWERLAEIAEILAAGLMRVRARQSTPQSADFRDSSLDCPADQSGHADVLNGGGK